MNTIADARRPLTPTSQSTFRRCDRLYHLTFDLGYRPLSVATSLRFGRMIHDGLEAWWRAIQTQHAGEGFPTEQDVHDAALRALHASDDTREADPFDLVKAEELLFGYHVRWYEETRTSLRVTHVEATFRGPLENPETHGISKTFWLAGKIDALAVDNQDRVVLIEHKTSSQDVSHGSPYWRRLRMDTQLGQYWVGAEQFAGRRVDAALWDVIRKIRLRPYEETPDEKKHYVCDKRCKGKCVGHTDGRLSANQHDHDETPDEFRARVREEIATKPDEYFVRGELTRLEDDVREFREQAWAVGQQILHNRRRDLHPRNPSACDAFGRMCEFFDVCTGVVSIDDPLLFTRVNNPYPELDLEGEPR